MVPAWPTWRRSQRFNPAVTLINVINDDDGMSQHRCFLSVNNRARRHSAACPPVAVPSPLPSTRKSSGGTVLSHLGLLCPCMQRAETWWGGSVNTALQGSTRVYLLKHQSHTEAVKENEGTDSQHSTHTTGTDLWRRFQMQSELRQSENDEI